MIFPPPAPPAHDWLRFAGIHKRFGAFRALDGIDLGIRKGEFVCLLGPSGCGKTTLLRILAGLEKHDAGSLSLGGRDIGHLPAGRRDYGIVFQSYALFPNLDVAANIAYGLRTGRMEKARRVSDLLDLVGLPGAECKYPAQLSGGQQQRVALARAIVAAPRVLLFDEPLSNLDSELRESLCGEMSRLLRQLGTTAVYVTHDRREADLLADRIVHLSAGRVAAVRAVTPTSGEVA